MKTNIRRILWLGILFPIMALACSLSTPFSAPSTPTVPKPLPTTSVPIQIPSANIVTNEDVILVGLYSRINPSVVNINTFSRQGGNVVPSGQGSGFVFDRIGHIVTNAHVVYGADQVEVAFSDNTIHRAVVVGEDLHSDLAVIQVEELPQGVLALPLGDMNEVAVGQTVVAIGNPFGLGGTLTKGIISALGRTIPALTAFSIPQSIQTDAPINPGNSGGPLLNLEGEVVGVNAQIETNGASRVNSGVGFAIPVSIVGRVVPELISSGEYQWAWLGVAGRSVNPPLVEAMDLSVNKGAYISEVVENGPSYKAGLQGATRETQVDGRLVEVGGDVIVAINGEPVNSFEDLLIYIALETNPGDEVILTVLSEGKSSEISVTLGTRPQESAEFFPFPSP